MPSAPHPSVSLKLPLSIVRNTGLASGGGLLAQLRGVGAEGVELRGVVGHGRGESGDLVGEVGVVLPRGLQVLPGRC